MRLVIITVLEVCVWRLDELIWVYHPGSVKKIETVLGTKNREAVQGMDWKYIGRGGGTTGTSPRDSNLRKLLLP